jgi:pullulanase/glycogen debranching enzyme
MTTWHRLRHVLVGTAAALVLVACGGDGGGGDTPPPVAPPVVDPNLADGNSANPRVILNAVPPSVAPSSPGTTVTSLKIHYRRPAGDYTGVMIHTYNAAVAPVWNEGFVPDGTDDFGVYFLVQLNASSGVVGYIFHIGDNKDDGGADQAYTLQPGLNEIWRIQDDLTTYTSNPVGAAPIDITTVRVHYQRFANDYSTWGLHLWDGSGLDVSRLGGAAIGDWSHPVAFSAMPAYALAPAEVTFDIPVVNPLTAPGATSVQFIIHGMPPNDVNDKDGRDANIVVNYANLTITHQVGEIWMVQQNPTVFTSEPDTRSVSTIDARAVWLTSKLVQWPAISSGSSVKLYWSATGQISAALGAPVSGADGSITLDAFTGTVPADVATRFKWVGSGSLYAVRDADVATLGMLHAQQVVIVQEDTGGSAQNATTAQVAGALDDLYAGAASVDLGSSVSGSSTTYKLWAPTAQSVMLYRYASGTSDAANADKMDFDAATGVWSHTVSSDTGGTYYRFGVKVFVRGIGLVRNLVTDPYSLTLAANSVRSEVVNLDDTRLKPAGWDASTPPATVSTATDQVVYELHPRDFSANDATVAAAHRGKYLAFTDTGSNGMQHLRALAAAGLTDVHLMPMFDFSSVPETGCTTPSPSGAADAQTQQAAVTASAGTDCYNWGYDPYHFNAPEGSYATSVDDGVTRVVEFRSMIQALNAAGLRVGMDVVFNHTTASGQNDHSVLDEIVPGYYYRTTAAGAPLNDSCCADTAPENHMMGKLLADSVVMWARDYHVSSFRYDIMGMLPRDVLVALQTKVDTMVGRHVEMLGEGWNFGAVANGARFVQASMFSLNGSGIGSFNPYLRDAVRGGSSFDTGNAMVSSQGFINGLFYDPNALGGGHTAGDLLWASDVTKAGLAGSIRSYVLNTSWDATLPLEQIDIGGNPLGFVVDPAEAVSYVENHDSQTLFDTNAYKLPVTTTQDDRARVQMLGAAIVSFSQGVAYFHAGIDTLRSKSLDKNSYESGDWFNKLDWSYADNNFGVGLPPQPANGDDWAVQGPLLANTLIKPTSAQIAWTRDQFRDLLKIRKSTSLLHMQAADDIKARLKFWNTGSTQVPTVIVGDVDGSGGYAGANFNELTYFINVDKQAHQIAIPALAARAFVLHPVHLAAGAADPRAATATYDSTTGTFSIPARTAVVFVVPLSTP